MKPTLMFCLVLVIAYLIPITEGTAANNGSVEAVIATLTDQLNTAGGAQEKSRLHCFRARNYAKIGEMERAEQDYRLALEYSPTGWLLNEYGFFLYHCGKYEQALEIARQTLQEFPHLQRDAAKLEEQARVKFEEAYRREHPPTIVMDTVVDPHRVTRHDLIRRLPPRTVVIEQPSRPAKPARASARATPKPKRS